MYSDISLNFKDSSFIDGMQMYLKNDEIYFHIDIDNSTYKKVMSGVEFKIYPTQRQKEILAKNQGCRRSLYNKYVEAANDCFEKHQLMKPLPYNYYGDEYPYFKDSDIDRCNLQGTQEDFEIALDRYRKKLSGSPTFKKKYDSKQTYRTKNNNNSIDILDKNHMKLPKLGKMECRSSIENFRKAFYGKIYNATLIQERDGSYYCSLTVEYYYKQYEKPETEKSIGMDLGIKNYIMFSNGIPIFNPRYLEKDLQEISRLERDLAR